MHLYKDEVLNRLAPTVNVAQFVSFAPDLSQRFAWVKGYSPNTQFASAREVCAKLLESAESHRLNIRSFKPESSKGHELIRDLDSVDESMSALHSRANNGFFTILNEVVPLDDGGVSGGTTS